MSTSEAAGRAGEGAAGPTLNLCGTELSASATLADILGAVDREPRGDDWYLIVGLPSDDVLEVTHEEGTFRVEIEGDAFPLQWTVSPVDRALLGEIVASFLAADGRWRSLATWETMREAPAGSAPKPAPDPSTRLVWAAAGIPIVLGVLAAMGKGNWAIALFLLAIPAALGAVILVKLGEVRRAALWKPASGRIVSSKLVRERRGSREVELPRVEYEFTVGFDKHRGSRVTIGEIMPGSPQVARIPALYPAGKGVTVYFNPANPKESVLDRDLPPHFNAVWVFVAVVAAACVAGAWLVVR